MNPFDFTQVTEYYDKSYILVTKNAHIKIKVGHPTLIQYAESMLRLRDNLLCFASDRW